MNPAAATRTSRGSVAIDKDLEHLKLLSIFHYVLGGLGLLMGCFPGIYIALGIAFLNGAMNQPGNQPPPPKELGWIFIAGGSVAILFAWAMAIALIIAGRKLAAHTSHTFCFIVAALSCLQIPFGTALGVCTLVVLSRPSVKELFVQPAPA